MVQNKEFPTKQDKITSQSLKRNIYSTISLESTRNFYKDQMTIFNKNNVNAAKTFTKQIEENCRKMLKIRGKLA